MKTKKISLITIFLIFAFAVVGAFASMRFVSVNAETKYDASGIFTENTLGAIQSEGGSNLKFSFGKTEDNTIEYNKDLAYKWYTGRDAVSYFSMEFSFAQKDFTTFTLAFQSAENNITKEKVAENKIVFTKTSSAYSVSVLNCKGVNTCADNEVDLDQSITVSFSEVGCVSGEFAVSVAVGSQTISGKFTNIGGNYAEASADILPLSFSAEAGDGATVVEMKSLNGQSFLLDENGKVIDNVCPVLAINDDIKSFVIGAKVLDFTYEVIDVCSASPTKELKYAQYAVPTESATSPTYKTLNSNVRIWDGEIFRSGIDAVQENGEKVVGVEYVSMKFTLKDAGANSFDYEVAWYAQDSSDIVSLDSVDYLRVIRDENAPEYVCINVDDANKEQTLDENNAAYLAYQQSVNEQMTETYAGEKYYFYLPSLEDLISDEETPYTGLSFTIYYLSDKNSSTSTLTSKKYDDLSIPVSSSGRYNFKVVACDKVGNNMLYWLNGAQVAPSSSNIWDIEAIPTFSFYVESKGIVIEDVETLKNATVGNNYTVSEFEIKGESGYKTKYTLYNVKSVGIANISYKEFVNFINDCSNDGIDISNQANFKTELNKKIEELGTTPLTDSFALVKISPWDSDGPTDEDDDGWDTSDNRYEWKSSSLSFTPQESGYYLVEMELASGYEYIYAYKVIYVSSEVDENKGQTYWIENNVVTVVFIILAAASAIAIVVIWIAAPSQETVEEKSVKNGKNGQRRRRSKKE